VAPSPEEHDVHKRRKQMVRLGDESSSRSFSDDGNTITGLSKLSQDGSTWDDDLAITYRRAA
jgi:hypothetical protein